MGLLSGLLSLNGCRTDPPDLRLVEERVVGRGDVAEAGLSPDQALLALTRTGGVEALDASLSGHTPLERDRVFASTDLTQFAVATRDGLLLWRRGQPPVQVQPPGDGPAPLEAAALRADGAVAATATRVRLSSVREEQRLLLWETETGARVADLSGLAMGMTTIRGLAWSPDGSLLAVTGAGEVRVIEPSGATQKGRREGLVDGPAAVTWLGSDRIVSATPDRHIVAWDATSGDPLWSSAGWAGRGSAARQMRVSPDGRRVAAAVPFSTTERLLLIDAETGRDAPGLLPEEGQRILRLGWSQDSRFVTAATLTGINAPTRMVVWDLEGRVRLRADGIDELVLLGDAALWTSGGSLHLGRLEAAR